MVLSLTEQNCISTQLELSKQIILRDTIELSTIKTVAGVDLAYWKEGDIEKAVCCIIVIDVSTLKPIEEKHSVGIIKFPYIPGCLAFRELPLVEETIKQLESNIDLFVFDGNGVYHPRKMGLASHASFLVKQPTIGIAKTFYKIENRDYIMPENEAWATSDLTLNGQVLGKVVRTHKDVKPIFLSVGNRISLDSAMKIVRVITGAESHIPVPTRLADLATHKYRSLYKV